MDKYLNIEDTKESQLAKTIENGLNSFSFDPKVFAASVKTFHPTLQQTFYKAIRECIKVMADDSRNYDDRNRASHEEAKAMLQYLQENGRAIPFI